MSSRAVDEQLRLAFGIVYGHRGIHGMTSFDRWPELARNVIGEPELTAPEVAAQAGVDLEQARRLWRALGFPPLADDQRVFTKADVATLQAVEQLVAMRGTDPSIVLQQTRVMGQSLARVAEAQVRSNTAILEALQSAVAPDDATIARIVPLLTTLEPILVHIWRRHLLASLLRVGVSNEADSLTAPTLVVGFADLVGFTAISQQLSEGELATMVDRFEALAYEHIPERGGRVIKMIGDEVMFCVEDPRIAAEIALALVAAYAGDDTLPEVRVGLALGPTLTWAGDLFGPTVNLASRLVNIARPGTVLASESLGQVLQTQGIQGDPGVHPDDDTGQTFELRHLRRLELKGIGAVRSWVVRTAASPDAASAKSSRRRRRE